MTSVKEAWASFAAATMPDDAHPIQVQEMRRGFYAGVWFLLMEVTATDYEQIPPEDAALRLLSWIEECTRFKQDVLKGRA